MTLGLDANVLIRYLVRDDERQFEETRALIRGECAKGEPVLMSLFDRDSESAIGVSGDGDVR